MSGVISLLPEHVINQIAAGEVVQRPSNIVKELLENAIDAGATDIKLIIKDAGKTLVQVIDNGIGMSSSDARLAFERHATSKINTADDLFNIHTKGFRGEALASIASVAHVELKTRQAEDEVANHIVIEGGNFVKQDICQAPVGSNFSVKNLFYNIPARRNFLKEDSTELKHIINEFERVALPHHGVSFSLHSNNNQLYNLPSAPLVQRIMGLFGNSYNQKLVTVDEQTPYVKISGYVGKPELAKKSKRDQYFFINNRFIKSPYLNAAMYEAFRNLITVDANPVWFLFIDINPNQIDINIHPTKTEIKFIDEKTVFNTLLSVIKRALGKAGVGPTIDFDQEAITSEQHFPSNRIPVQPSIQVNTSFNPFKSNQKEYSHTDKNVSHWESLYEGFKNDEFNPEADVITQQDNPLLEINTDFKCFQLMGKYIVCNSDQGLLLIDQKRAHEHVLFEHYKKNSQSQALPSQQILFPEQIEFNTKDSILIKDLLPSLKTLGFDIEIFGKNSIVINGVPSQIDQANITNVIENILESYKLNAIEIKLDVHNNMCLALAKNTSIKYGRQMNEEEAKELVNELFQLPNPVYTIEGKLIYQLIDKQEIEKIFKR
ncbi:MAG: DNA mismatch repair endonuclease MutL [Bacteroidia bacterium]